MTSDASEGQAVKGSCGPSATLTRCSWQARYDQGKTGWDRGAASPTLLRWLAKGDLQPCRILVPGCGRGHEVVALAKAGFDVTGVDFAPAAVETVRAQLASEGLAAVILQSDLFAYRPDRPFEAIYEQTCLCALPPERWAATSPLPLVDVSTFSTSSIQAPHTIHDGGRSAVCGPAEHTSAETVVACLDTPWNTPHTQMILTHSRHGDSGLGYVLGV